MAEHAPLTTAHQHVRKAAQVYQQVNYAAAAEQHQLASNDFARAARSTNDSEALRVLNLLEEQHRKLARLIKDQDATQQDLTLVDAKSSALTSLAQSPLRRDTADESDPSAPLKARQPALASSVTPGVKTGAYQRDSSPSLAREMASRRGIPPARSVQSAAAQARARPRSPESWRKASARTTAQIPPSIVDSEANLRSAAAAKKAADDESFSKFYSSLTTGTMSKISSVLAFAGLPLTATEAAFEQNVQPKQNKQTVSASHEPNVKKLFSKAALDAIEEEHRSRGTFGHGFGPAESFYVVQKGGGTYSYADIARAQQQQMGGIITEDEEPEFVDAKEVQGQSSPKQTRFPQQSQRGSFGNPRTNEELDLENITLKQTLQDLAGRLAAFEAHAQDASFAALTQSVATLRPQGPPDVATQERIRQLEKEVEAQAEERQKLEGLASKQEKTLKKYHAKFEELKKSAREKEKAKKEKAAAGSSAVETVVANTA